MPNPSMAFTAPSPPQAARRRQGPGAEQRRCPLGRSIGLTAHALVSGMLLLATSQWVCGQEPVPQVDGTSRQVSTADATDRDLIQSEETLASLIRQEADNQEAQGRLANKQFLELGPGEAALKALRKNLSIQQSQIAERIAQAALVEAQAVFDPVVLLSFRYDRSETFTRIEQDQRVRQATNEAVSGFEERPVIPVDDPRDTTGTVIVFEQTRPGGPAATRVAASLAPITGPTGAFNYEVTLEQQLPWGTRLELLYRAVDQDTFFIDNAAVLADNPNPPLDLVNFGSFDRPWVSSLLTRLTLPVPGSREFGRYAEQEVGIYRARFDKERAFWDVEATINSTLLEVDLGYWDLIRALLSLQATVENRQLVEERLQVAERRFELREATNYDLAQVQDELARVRGEEERAWNSYVLTSDALVRLLDLPASHLLLPKGYQDVLQRPFIAPTEQTISANPQRLVATVDVEQARLDEARNRVRKRPDINFLAEAEFSQSNGVFGYDSFAESLGNITDPDVITQAYSLEYLYPWGNRAVKAAYAQAEADRERQQLLLRETENRLSRQLRDALVELASTAERVDITARNAQLAALAYEKAVSEEQARLTREVEVVTQSVRLLNARLEHVRALAERKQAETQILATTGVLGKVYAERLARNQLERYRLSLLKANGMLQHFGSQGISAR
ncbi:MAG: TolC family protein [Gammaproteobacteria bacterium]